MGNKVFGKIFGKKAYMKGLYEGGIDIGIVSLLVLLLYSFVNWSMNIVRFILDELEIKKAAQGGKTSQEVIAAQDREYIDALEKSKVDKNVQVVQNSDCTMSFKAGDTINLSTEESKISRIYCSS